MTAKPVTPRALAVRDAEDALDYYLREGGQPAALGFVEALEQAYAHISRFPGSGSSRYAHELDLPGLKCWPLSGYPYLLFYLERDDSVDVWRVLHGERDIPAWMRGATEQP